MVNMFNIELDRSAKISVWVSLGLLGLLGYFWGLLLIMMTSPADSTDDDSARTIWTCRVQEQDGFELLEKSEDV